MSFRWLGIIFTVVALIGGIGLPALGQTVLPRVASYELDATFFPANSAMEATATLTLDSVPECDSLLMFLHGELCVDSTRIDGKIVNGSSTLVFYPYEYSAVAKRLILPVEPGLHPRSVTVYYGGQFNPSKATAPSNYMKIDSDGVFLRSYGYSLWFPIALKAGRDDYNVDFSHVTIRTPLPFLSVFIGNQLNADTTDGWYVSEWSIEDVAIREAQCVARPFVISGRSPVLCYHMPDSLSVRAADYIVSLTEQLLAFYQETYGGSAGEIIYMVEMPRYGDISDANMVGLSSKNWQGIADLIGPKSTLAHELVHPFIQRNVSRDDRLFCYRVEGFATFYDIPALDAVVGSDYMASEMEEIERRYMKAKSTGLNRRGRPLPKEIPIAEVTADQVGVYKDGYILAYRTALFSYWLLRQMGKEEFFEYSREAFALKPFTEAAYLELVEKYLPGSQDDVHVWLETNDYPDRFRLGN